MPTRLLGKNGPQVSAISFGAMNLSGAYGSVASHQEQPKVVASSEERFKPSASDEERFKVLDRAIELGSTHFDTADVYGDNEDLLGKYFKKYPHQRKKVSKNI
jgi:aryl-alcohol dehydrogenase-like predicted oxidoreductase